MTFEVRTTGLRELRAALDEVHGRIDPDLGKALRAAAVPVQEDVKQRAEGYGSKTVSGVHIRRTGTRVRVQQDARKTTGRHPEFGSFQQRHFFDPALADHQDEAIIAAREAVDRLAALVNAAP